MSDYTLMTVAAFVSSYDRDILDLQEHPVSYISEIEAQLVLKYRQCMGFNSVGTSVWPVQVLKAHLDIHGEPQWPEENLVH